MMKMLLSVVIPYYLSLRYNILRKFPALRKVVIPYYLSLRYNIGDYYKALVKVVIPYYLSLRYNIPAKKDEVPTQYPVFLV